MLETERAEADKKRRQAEAEGRGRWLSPWSRKRWPGSRNAGKCSRRNPKCRAAMAQVFREGNLGVTDFTGFKTLILICPCKSDRRRGHEGQAGLTPYIGAKSCSSGCIFSRPYVAVSGGNIGNIVGPIIVFIVIAIQLMRAAKAFTKNKPSVQKPAAKPTISFVGG